MLLKLNRFIADWNVVIKADRKLDQVPNVSREFEILNSQICQAVKKKEGIDTPFDFLHTFTWKDKFLVPILGKDGGQPFELEEGSYYTFDNFFNKIPQKLEKSAEGVVNFNRAFKVENGRLQLYFTEGDENNGFFINDKFYSLSDGRGLEKPSYIFEKGDKVYEVTRPLRTFCSQLDIMESFY